MQIVEWKYIPKHKTGNEVDVLEMKYHYKLPDDLKECIKKNNAGMPYPSKFDTATSKNKVFGGLLSFNKGEDDNIYDFITLFESVKKNELSMFPFGLDPFGNIYCVKDDKIVLWNHEEEVEEFISESFSDFLNMMHD